MSLSDTLSNCWLTLQGQLFPWLEEELGPLGDRHKKFITVLELVRVETFVHHDHAIVGCPRKDRAALARSFLAKAVFNIPQTDMLIERLSVDKSLRRLCGWTRLGALPSESTFSRAFAEFSASALPSRMHDALIKKTHEDRLVGHISRDATAIEAREKPLKVARKYAKQKHKRGRPRKGEERPQKIRRLERQQTMSVAELLADLPRHCAVGTKRNAKGYQTSWTGYKLHLDVTDGGIPVSCLLTSASLHDSQVAIPLATLTASKLTNLYDLMDSAYDAPEIKAMSASLGHIAIIDNNPRSSKRKKELAEEAKAKRRVGHRFAEDVRYNERSTVERVNGRLKDEFGGRTLRVRGHDKVLCHLMFGVLALSVDQLMRLLI